MLQVTYVSQQQGVLEDFFNELSDINGVKGEFFIENLKPIKEAVDSAELAEILTINERRELAGYKPLENSDTIVQKTTMFSKEDDEKLVRAFKNRFKFESKKANALLGVLNSTPDLTKTELEELTGLDGSEIDNLLNELQEEGLVNENGIPTTEGSQVQQEIFVVYKYGLRFELRGEKEVLPTTRDFCSNLVRLSKTRSWTIEDINAMNNDQGLDVFSSRGGFWNDAKTGITHPYCRHIWEQRLVTRKV